MARVTWHGAEIVAKAKATTMDAVYDGAEMVLSEAQDEVPYAEGELSSHGTITVSPSEMAAYISFTGPYAVRQHEDETLQHPDPTNPKSLRGRKAKYLEDPLHKNKSKIRKLVSKRLDTALR